MSHRVPVGCQKSAKKFTYYLNGQSKTKKNKQEIFYFDYAAFFLNFLNPHI